MDFKAAERHKKHPDVWNADGTPVNMKGLTPSERRTKDDMPKYYTFECSKCGKEATNSFTEPHYTNMIRNRECFYCDLHRETAEKLRKFHKEVCIIDGRWYLPGERETGNFRGMAGRRFDIEFIEPSVHAGKKITTYDLWAGSELTAEMMKEFPDTAKFYDGAEEVKLKFKDPKTGEPLTEEEAGKRGAQTRCWNPSSGKEAPFPNPRTLTPRLRGSS